MEEYGAQSETKEAASKPCTQRDGLAVLPVSEMQYLKDQNNSDKLDGSSEDDDYISYQRFFRVVFIVRDIGVFIGEWVLD